MSEHYPTGSTIIPPPALGSAGQAASSLVDSGKELQSARADLARLNGEATVLRRLLREADGVIGTIEPEDTHTADLLKELRCEIAAALNPEPPAGGLF